jgi:hypothetical protein
MEMSVVRRPFMFQRWVLIPLVVAVTVVTNVALATSAAAQDDTFDYTIYKAYCEEPLPPPERGTGEPNPPLTDSLPDGCEFAEGIVFTVSDVEGKELDSCTTDASGVCGVTLPMSLFDDDFDADFVIEEEESTARAGYTLPENPITTSWVPNEFNPPYINLANLPDDTTDLPDTGAGLAAEPAGNAWVPVLLAVGLLLAIAGVRSRPFTGH